MNVVERVVRRIDRFQQHHLVPGLIVGVAKKFGDDAAGTLVTNLAFSSFVTIFPMLLLLVTILGLVLANNQHLRDEIVQSTFHQIPLIGHDLTSNVSALHRNSLIGLFVALLFLVWGSLGLAQNGIYTMEQVWNLPGVHRSNFVRRLGRSLEFLGVLAIGLGASTILAAIATNSAGRSLLVDVVAVAGSLVLNAALFIVSFRVLTPPVVRTRSLLVGALAGGVGWTVLQSLGTYLVGRVLHNETPVYGSFAVVLGLIFWISLAVRLVVYSAELNVVLERRLWPRSIVQPPLTAADRKVLAAQATQNQRRPEQIVHVSFADPAPAGPSDAPAPPAGAPPGTEGEGVAQREAGAGTEPTSDR